MFYFQTSSLNKNPPNQGLILFMRFDVIMYRLQYKILYEFLRA
jgi:hypothetical protein